MKKLLLLTGFGLLSYAALAQSSRPLQGARAEQNLQAIGDPNNLTGVVQTYDNRYEGIKGSPYFLPQWGKGKIAAGKTIYDNIDMNYNVYENNIIYRRKDGSPYILGPDQIEYFELQDSTGQRSYTFKRLPALAAQDAKLASQFGVVLFEGKVTSFIAMPEKSILKADYKGGYSSGRNYDEFLTGQSYYLVGPGSAVQKVKLSKRNLLKALQDKDKQVEQYLKAENIDAGTEQGWAKALAFYETL